MFIFQKHVPPKSFFPEHPRQQGALKYGPCGPYHIMDCLPQIYGLTVHVYGLSSRSIGTLKMVGVPELPGSQMFKIAGVPVFPCSQVIKTAGVPVFPGSQVIKMAGFPVFPGSQVIKMEINK